MLFNKLHKVAFNEVVSGEFLWSRDVLHRWAKRGTIIASVSTILCV